MGLFNWGQGGLTHSNGAINPAKCSEAVGAWLLFDLDIILFSEMQPNADTAEPPQGPYILDFAAEPTRRAGCGTGAAIKWQLAETITRLNPRSAPRQSGYWLCAHGDGNLILAAWYGPVHSNNRSAAQRKRYWHQWAAALAEARVSLP